MEQLRGAFNNMVRSERYSRFSLQPGRDGTRDGTRHVEVKLSDDTLDDTAEANGQLEGGSPSYQPHPAASHRRRNLCYVALGALLLFLVGYLIGYASHHKQPNDCPVPGTVPPPAATTTVPAATTTVPAATLKPSLDWRDITRLLSEKLSVQALTEALSDLDDASRSAGSSEDIVLVNRIKQQFSQLQMKPWTDTHYVQLQTQDSRAPNTIRFGSEVFQPKGYLAYSPKRHVQGKMVYGNYGGPEDFILLGNKSIELKGNVMLLRASAKISPAQQVANAASVGASAVLVYPDPQDYKYNSDTDLFGHVHLGSGDPYTPGFPSFNSTQFPSTNSSGLPSIPAQTITADMAAAILRDIGGPEVEAEGSFRGNLSHTTYKLGGAANVTVEVNNVPVNHELHNVFGVIEGHVDPDQYVVIGAQRDSWCRGYARSTVGTAILLELAKAIHQMKEEDGFRPKRSILFASWSAGEYGNVGATEWLEAHISSLTLKVFTYISLDGVVMGKGSFMASASPLLHLLMKRTMKDVKSPTEPGTVFDTVKGEDWLKPMALENPAYPFLSFSGIPSLSFHIITKGVEAYPYYGTCLDNRSHLEYATGQKLPETAVAAATLAGQMALRLVHDHLLPLYISTYSPVLAKPVDEVVRRVLDRTRGISSSWLSSACGSFKRAATSISQDILKTDLQNSKACRALNERIMTVEHCFLSPYVAPQVTPFRHLLMGRGAHTLGSLLETSDNDQLKVQLALATWTLQSCADGMATHIWEVDNEM